jgi:hypothetical protein
MAYFIGGRVQISDNSKKIEMDDQFLVEMGKYATHTVVLKVSTPFNFISKL